jgi:flavin reductase (DIM6/NTAB) family NADH-FMN oxidoreductase RutF
LLAGALASFECQLDRTVDGGDHLLFIGRVMRIRWSDGQPLVFSAGRYCSTQALPVAGANADLDAVWKGLG